MANPTKQATEAKAGFTFRKYKDGDHQWRRWQDQIFTADATDKCPTYVHKTPPCQASCPSGEDIRGWLNIVRGIEKLCNKKVEINWPEGQKTRKKQLLSNAFTFILCRNF